MASVNEINDLKKELQNYKEKFSRILEEKSILEDEIVSLASLARKYQTQEKTHEEELESLKSSYNLICQQNSELESEVISKNSLIDQLEKENMDLRILTSEYYSELQKYREASEKDASKTIRELSNIILSKDRISDSPNAKYSELVKDSMESKIRQMEKERNEYYSKYKESHFKYISCLKELISSDQLILKLSNNQEYDSQEYIKNKIQLTEFEMRNAEKSLEGIECDEISYYTSLTESPKISNCFLIKKPNDSTVPLSFFIAQASMIENMIKNNS